MPLNGRAETADQDGLVEGLDQEADRPVLKRSGMDVLFGNGRDKNERYAISLSPQTGLQVDSAHRRHANIANHAPRIVHLLRLQEGLSGGKHINGVSKRPYEVVYRHANGCIVINDCDYRDFRQDDRSWAASRTPALAT